MQQANTSFPIPLNAMPHTLPQTQSIEKAWFCVYRDFPNLLCNRIAQLAPLRTERQLEARSLNQSWYLGMLIICTRVIYMANPQGTEDVRLVRLYLQRFMKILCKPSAYYSEIGLKVFSNLADARLWAISSNCKYAKISPPSKTSYSGIHVIIVIAASLKYVVPNSH